MSNRSADPTAAGNSKIPYRCYQCGRRFESASRKQRLPAPCGHTPMRWRARITYFGGLDLIRTLAAGPQRRNDVRLSSAARPLVRQLKVPHGGTGDQKTRPGRKTATNVVYLPGDERAAMRLFIEANRAFVDDCLTDPAGNPLSHNWRDEEYQLLVEQWEWMDGDGGDES